MAMGVGPRLRGVVLRALVARGVGAALREREALDRERAALLAQLAPGPVAWDAAASGRRPDAHRRLAAIDGRRHALSEGLGRAFVEVATECPPFEIVTRVEALADLALRETSTGLAPGGAADALAEELDALAWRVAELWAPGYDPDAVAAAFADRSIWSRAQPDLGPPTEDERLGWAPVGLGEVLARAATSAAGHAFVALCASATQEAAEADAVAARLEEARGEVSSLAAMVGRGMEDRRRVDVLTHRLTQERHEAKAAFEAAWHAALRAAEVTPPLAIHGALRAAAAILQVAGEVSAPVVGPDGSVRLATSPCGRALVLAALADVRAACDRAFPGLGILAGGGPGALRVFAAAERSQGPYRGQPAPEAAVEPGGAAAHERALVSILDGPGAPAEIARALGHGTALAALAPRSQRPGVAERLMARSTAAGDATSLRAARVSWHRGALVDRRRALVIGCARAELPLTVLHEALLQVHLALAQVRVITLSYGPIVEHAAGLHGQTEAIAAVDRLAAASAAVFGLPPAAWAVAEAVAARLRGGPPSGAAIDTLADELRATSFQHGVDALSRLAREEQEARRGRGEAMQAVTWLDKLNVFVTSDSEKEVDEAHAAVNRAELEVRQAMAGVRDLFFRAVERHPALALHVAIDDLRGAVLALRGYLGGRYSPPSVLGIERAGAMIRAWGAHASARLGGLEPAASVLERYAAAKLRAREGFSA